MSDVHDQVDEASELEAHGETSWTERLGNAVSDYEVMGAEDAAGLGL